LAWLAAPIVDGKGVRGKSRRQQIISLAEVSDEDPDFQFPEKGPLEYLINYLSEIGEAELNGENLTSIGWQTMRAWAEMTGTQLTSGEALSVHQLSGVYVSQYYQSSDAACPAPHLGNLPARDEIADKMKTLFSMLRSNK
jgi:hypothetical protein